MIFSIEILSQNCEVPDVLLDNYEKDVKHLTLLRMEQFNAPELGDVEISELWQDTIWKGLAAIFNSDSDERDQVFDQYCIHQNSWTSSNYNRISNSIYVKLDTSASWFQNWENETITTNDSFLDSLFIQFGFDSVRFTFPIINVFSLYTDEYLNLEAFSELIEMNDNIVYAERITGAGDYSEIIYNYIGEEQFFDFTIGWGDCPSGCIFQQTWSFKIDELCNVTFLGIQADDDGVPNAIDCNLSTPVDNTNNKASIKISPNPFIDKISILSGIENSLIKYTLLSVNGKKLLEGQFVDNEISDLYKLNSGIYFLIIEGKNKERSIHKIIKLN